MDNRKVFPPRKQKQKPLGPAPIASFENTSTDELKYEVNKKKLTKFEKLYILSCIKIRAHLYPNDK